MLYIGRSMTHGMMAIVTTNGYMFAKTINDRCLDIPVSFCALQIANNCKIVKLNASFLVTEKNQ